MPGRTSWVQQLKELRAEIADQFGVGKATAGTFARIDRLASEIETARDLAPDEVQLDVPPRTAEVFGLIRSLYGRLQRKLTNEEICGAIHIHTRRSVDVHLDRLESKGLIRRERETPGRRWPVLTVTIVRTTPKKVNGQETRNSEVVPARKAARNPPGKGGTSKPRESKRGTIGMMARMIRDDCEIPKYCRQPGTNEVVVTIRGKVSYLGDYDLEETRELYDKLMYKYFSMDLLRKRANFTISAMCGHYRARVRDTLTGEQADVALLVCDELCQRHGQQKTTALGRKGFVGLRRAWAREGADPPTIERRTDALIEMYRWAVREDLTTGNTLEWLIRVRKLWTI